MSAGLEKTQSEAKADLSNTTLPGKPNFSLNKLNHLPIPEHYFGTFGVFKVQGEYLLRLGNTRFTAKELNADTHPVIQKNLIEELKNKNLPTEIEAAGGAWIKTTQHSIILHCYSGNLQTISTTQAKLIVRNLIKTSNHKDNRRVLIVKDFRKPSKYNKPIAI